MAFALEYFHPRVLAEIERWPVDVLADYARLAELLVEHGPNLRLPYSRPMGGSLSSGPEGGPELDERSTVSSSANE